MQPIDIENSFTYHAPTPDQIGHYQALRDAAKQFAYAIVEHVPDGPYKTLAIRRAEAAVMWANKGIACAPDQGGQRRLERLDGQDVVVTEHP